MTGIYLVLFVVCGLCYYLWTQRAKHINLPGPPWHWFYGTYHSLKANMTRMYDYRLDCARKYGRRGMWKSGIPFRRAHVHLTDPALVEYILKTNFENYIKSKVGFDRTREFFGYGIFAVNGKEWAFQRKTASHMFSMRSLRNTMFPDFIDTGNKILSIIEKHAQSGEKFDIQSIFFRATMDAICLIAYGENVGCLDVETMPDFARAFDILQAQLILRFMDPLWLIKKALQIGDREKVITVNIKLVNKLAYEIVKKRRVDIEAGKERHDLLSKFLEFGQKNRIELSDSFLRDVVMSFIIAGRDTTACGLTWTVYELASNPEFTKTLHQEIDQWGEVNYNNVNRSMEFGEACFMEALRLHPSVPAESMTSLADDTFPNGFKIKENTIVSYDPYVLNRNPNVYDDPETFTPKRWLEKKPPTQYQYPTFNGGPRLCLGKHVAILEAKTLLAQIFRKYDLQLVPDVEIHYAMSILLPVKGGLWVTAKPRNV